MYNNYIEPRGLIHDADFLTHDFMPTMLDALGLQDTSGVIFEVVEHDYFNITDLGMWDQMMPGMINVSSFRHLEAKTAAFASRTLGSSEGIKYSNQEYTRVGYPILGYFRVQVPENL